MTSTPTEPEAPEASETTVSKTSVSEVSNGRPRKKSHNLTFVDLKKRFAHLFPEKAGDTIAFDTTTPVETWIKTGSKQKVEPLALSQFIGRVFALKHGIPINGKYINTYLNGSGKKPIELRRLPLLVSKAVDALIKGPTERPDREPDHVARELPGHRCLRFDPAFMMQPGEKRERDHLILAKNSPDFIVNKARGLITPLKGIAPDTQQGTEKEICAKVFTLMRKDCPVDEVSDDLLRACIVAAWDQLGIN